MKLDAGSEERRHTRMLEFEMRKIQAEQQFELKRMELMQGMGGYRPYSQSNSGSYDHMQQPTPQSYDATSILYTAVTATTPTTIVQALYDMTSHKLQQKLFYLFCTPEGILFDV